VPDGGVHSSPTPWSRLPGDLPAALRTGLAATVDAIAAEVKASVPEFSRIEDTKFARDLHDGVRIALERFVDLVATNEPALTPAVHEVYRGLGAAEARDDRGPEILVLALRLSSRLLLRAAVETVSARRPLTADEVVDLSDAVTTFTDELASASTEGFALQLREQAGETDRRRRHLGELLLRGGASPAAVGEAASAVGRPRPRIVVPVLLPADQARAARFRFGADGIVVERATDAVLLLFEAPRATREHLAERLHGQGAVVAPALGWERVPTGLHLAEVAARATAGRTEGGAPVFVTDHLADLTVRGHEGAAAVLAERRLAPFDAVSPALQHRLQLTLYLWLRHWGSRPEVAEALFVHPQTVSYRLRQVRALVGDDLDDPQARFELLLALVHRLES
jgi:hypothetical protein